MPLRDHFHSPVNDTHSWDEVHGQWPGEIVRTLKPLLPAGFRAAPQIHLGSPFEVDVSTYDLDSRDRDAPEPSGGGTATQAALVPTYTVEAELADQDEYEVRVYDTDRGRKLVATIELVSPSNKDRPENRELFIGKVAALLQQDVCVSIVDLVSIRRANMYADLLTLYGRVDPKLAPKPPHLYAVTVRGRRPPKGGFRLESWFYPMTVGEPLPTLPIWLTADLQILLPLETSYQEACGVLGIP
jgi:Protein of unknown function (DUF4058)